MGEGCDSRPGLLVVSHATGRYMITMPGHESRPRPFENCYWVPGVPVLAGEYPFHPAPGLGAAKLNDLLDAGVTCLIDLTRPEDGLTPYASELERQARSRGLALRHVPLGIPDMGIPGVERMVEVLDAIDGALRAGERPYVHCWGGVGRTGTVVGCYLVRHGLDAEAAVRKVGELFATMSPGKVRDHPEGAPQTEAQRRFVRDWHERPLRLEPM
jgi:protein-tyrosine phosphatase